MKKTCLILLMFLPLLIKAQSIEKRYKIFDVKNDRQINIEDLVDGAISADVIFFGEEHNDSIAHYLELTLFKKLAFAYPNKTALSLEMFHTDVQHIVDEYLLGLIAEKSFIKEARAWNNYTDYKPLIEFAKIEKIPVVAANAAARYSNAVSKNGLETLRAFPSNVKAFFPPAPIDTLVGRYHQKFIDLLGGHSVGGLKVYQTQNFWDATMAWSIAKFTKKHPGFKLLHVNGRFHSDEKLGTYAQLKRYAPKLKTINISVFAAEDFKDPNWEQHKPLGDYIILTDPNVKKTF